MNILHLYWGLGRPLSWLRYMTVVSFLKHNPDWQVYIWYAKGAAGKVPWATKEQKKPYTGKCMFDKLCKLDNVTAWPVKNMPKNMHDVHKSDLIRWYALANYGGFWSDFDILYCKPMTELPDFGELFLISYEMRGEKIWPIGFMGCNEEGMGFFQQVFEEAYAIATTQPLTNYQQLGRFLLEKHVKQQGGMASYDRDYVYPYVLQRMAIEMFSKPMLMNETSIGVHWYAGNDNIRYYEEIIQNKALARKVLAKDCLIMELLNAS